MDPETKVGTSGMDTGFEQLLFNPNSLKSISVDFAERTCLSASRD